MRLESYIDKKTEYDQPYFSVQPHPWLVICDKDDKQTQTFFSISEDRYELKTIPELKNKEILAYGNDWLVLRDIGSNDCYIWNHISMDKIQLPPLPEETDNYECLLSAPPHDLECGILFYEQKEPLYFCKPGRDQEFHKQEWEIIEDDGLMRCTVLKGKFYGLTLQNSILVLLDMDHDSGKVIITPMVNQSVYDHLDESIDIPYCEPYLIHSHNDELLYVHMLMFGQLWQEVYGFLVFRFDFLKKIWVKVNSIGETAIFLCNIWGTTCSTRGTNLKRESIYFSLHKDRRLYVYNLETESISVSLPCPYVSRRNSKFYWFTLPHQCSRQQAAAATTTTLGG